MLIAKMEEIANIKNFRPINLAWSIYKLIMKVLTKRMTKMIDKVVGECQHIFVERRYIMNVALVANKVVDNLIFPNREGILCKLDIEKVNNTLFGDLLNTC